MLQLVSIWANGQVTWDFKEGGQFALFGGNVTGTFTKIVRLVEFSLFFNLKLQDPNKEIVQKWRLKNYPSDHFANIKFILKDLVSIPLILLLFYASSSFICLL